jgi:transcriptional regulator with XRE-family HTH domain
MEEPRMSNPTDPVRENAVFDVLVLAAVERAARHRARDHDGVPVWAIRDHLHIAGRSPVARRLRVRLSVLESGGLLGRERRRGVVLWSPTDAGRQRLGAGQSAVGVPQLPESPQHIAWREARAAAQERMGEFDEVLGQAALGAFVLLDAGRAGERVGSDEWFAMAERLQRACRHIGSAVHCLYEWAEPSDEHADVDDRCEPGDDELEPPDRVRLRARRMGRRNITLWDAWWSAPSARTVEDARLLITLGQVIGQLRSEREISVDQLAGASGLTQARLAEVEAGRSDPRYEGLLALAQGLDVTPAELLARVVAEAKHRILTVKGRVMCWRIDIHDDAAMVVLMPVPGLDHKALQDATIDVERLFDEHVARGASASTNLKTGCIEVDIAQDAIAMSEIARKLTRLDPGAKGQGT